MTTADAARVTVLVENWIDMLLPDAEGLARHGLIEHFEHGRPRVQAEFGISFLIEVRLGARWHSVIFDAGLTAEVAQHNLRALQVDASSIGHVAISHGHPDHYGGIYAILAAVGHPVPVITHEDAFLPRYALMGDGRTAAFYNATFRPDDVDRAGGRLVLTREPVEIGPGIITSGEIPRQTEFEGPRASPDFHGPGLYQVKGGKFGLDEVWDEMALIVNVRDQGLIVLTGCGHAGVINSVDAARSLTGIDRVALVAGGFHLGFPTTPAANIDKTVAALLELEPSRVMPMHCTGLPATSALRSKLGDSFVQPAVGTVLEIGE